MGLSWEYHGVTLDTESADALLSKIYVILGANSWLGAVRGGGSAAPRQEETT